MTEYLSAGGAIVVIVYLVKLGVKGALINSADWEAKEWMGFFGDSCQVPVSQKGDVLLVWVEQHVIYFAAYA